MTPPAHTPAGTRAPANPRADTTVDTAIDTVAAVTARLTEPVRMCVLEVGQTRGRRDADDLLAAVPAGKIAVLCADVVAPGFNTGELAAALHRLGALEAASLFPANANGYFHTFCCHTVAVMLTEQERDLLTRTGCDESTVAVRLHDVCAWALMHGWETAVAIAFTAATTSDTPAARQEACT